jgi:hypothetical protein
MKVHCQWIRDHSPMGLRFRCFILIFSHYGGAELRRNTQHLLAQGAAGLNRSLTAGNEPAGSDSHGIRGPGCLPS